MEEIELVELNRPVENTEELPLFHTDINPVFFDDENAPSSWLSVPPLNLDAEVEAAINKKDKDALEAVLMKALNHSSSFDDFPISTVMRQKCIPLLNTFFFLGFLDKTNSAGYSIFFYFKDLELSESKLKKFADKEIGPFPKAWDLIKQGARFSLSGEFIVWAFRAELKGSDAKFAQSILGVSGINSLEKINFETLVRFIRLAVQAKDASDVVKVLLDELSNYEDKFQQAEYEDLRVVLKNFRDQQLSDFCKLISVKTDRVIERLQSWPHFYHRGEQKTGKELINPRTQKPHHCLYLLKLCFPLHFTAFYGSVIADEEVEPSEVNEEIGLGMTPLHVAAACGNLRAIEALIKLGANVLVENKAGKTALQLLPRGISCRLLEETEKKQREGLTLLELAKRTKNKAELLACPRFDREYVEIIEHRFSDKEIAAFLNQTWRIRNKEAIVYSYYLVARYLKNNLNAIPRINAIAQKLNPVPHPYARIELVKNYIARGGELERQAFGYKEKLTALEYALKEGDLKLAEWLVLVGANLDAVKNTCLESASFSKHVEVVQWLIGHGADFNQKNSYGYSLLCNASVFNHSYQSAKVLFEAGAEFHHPHSKRLLSEFVDDDTLSINKKLIDLYELKACAQKRQGSSSTEVTARYSKKPVEAWPQLVEAVKKGDSEEVCLLLKDNRASRDKNEAFACALEKNDYAIAKILIDHNADINSVFGLLKLFLTIKNNLDAINFLKENKVNLDQRSETGRTALYYCIEQGYVEFGMRLIEAGVSFHDIDSCGSTAITVIDREIAKNEKSKKELDEFRQAMRMPTVYGSDRLKSLKEEVIQLDGKQKLIKAAGSNHLDECKRILESNDFIGLDINATICLHNYTELGITEFTALHSAAACGHLEVCKYLIEKGAGLEVRTKERLTARDLAEEYGKKEVVTFLDGVTKARENSPEKLVGILTGSPRSRSPEKIGVIADAPQPPNDNNLVKSTAPAV